MFTCIYLFIFGTIFTNVNFRFINTLKNLLPCFKNCYSPEFLQNSNMLYSYYSIRMETFKNHNSSNVVIFFQFGVTRKNKNFRHSRAHQLTFDLTRLFYTGRSHIFFINPRIGFSC